MTVRTPVPLDVTPLCGKLANQYLARARKAIQGYFGPDSTQYAQIGGTRKGDRKSGGRRVKIATLPQAA